MIVLFVLKENVDADTNITVFYGSNVQILDSTKGGHTDRVFKVIQLFPNESLIASSGNDKVVKIWNATGGNLLQNLIGHIHYVWSLAYLDNGLIASGSVDRTIKIWEISTGNLKFTLPKSSICDQTKRVCNFNNIVGHTSNINTLSAMPNSRLVSGSFDKTVRVWNILNGDLVKTFRGHNKTVKTVLYLPFNSLIASESLDGTVRIWDLNGLSDQAKFVFFYDNPLKTITDLKDGRIATSSNNFEILVWNTVTGGLIHIFNGHTDIVHSFLYLDSGYLVSGSKDRTVRVWDVKNYLQVNKFDGYPLSNTGHRSSVYILIALPGGIVASGSYDKTIKLWDIINSKYLLTYSNESTFGKTAHSAAIMSATYINERMFATASLDSTVRVWRYDFYNILLTSTLTSSSTTSTTTITSTSTRSTTSTKTSTSTSTISTTTTTRGNSTWLFNY